tara:strand:- start:894 stop:1181 length:288 start_codon:yes stop_codon:yes gene_type:complete
MDIDRARELDDARRIEEQEGGDCPPLCEECGSEIQQIHDVDEDTNRPYTIDIDCRRCDAIQSVEYFIKNSLGLDHEVILNDNDDKFVVEIFGLSR